jgi:23S rRNA (cytosine1962-C5)-methyltransferase
VRSGKSKELEPQRCGWPQWWFPCSMASLLKLRITAVAERHVRSGHPWVYSDSITDASRAGDSGEVAAIYDRKKDKLLALGLYDPQSPLAVRVLHVGKPVKVDDAWWAQRMADFMTERSQLIKHLCDGGTDGFRLINGESSGWPGLVVDAYGGVLVMKLYTAAWLPYVERMLGWLAAALPFAHSAVVLRLARSIQATAEERYGLREGCIQGVTTDTVQFLENGLRFEAEVIRGQKTGFFLDQRENRSRVETMAEGRDVLNAFSFSGGFSVYAARGGARSVTDLDISQHALDSARRNMALNPGLERCSYAQVKADCFEWLARGPEQSFDLIICDPPSLAKREADRPKAIQAYHQLAQSCWARLRRGGILLAASCSAHVSEEEFRAATLDATGHPRELWHSGHAADHVAHFAEAHYLKGLALLRE